MRQKRSQSIAWTKRRGARPALAMAMATGLYGCSNDDEQTHLVTSIQDCLDQNYWNEEICETAYASALSEAHEQAPNYASEQMCENDFGFGNCDYDNDRGFFFPAMTGFLLAEAIDEVGDLYKKKKPRSVYSFRNRSGSGLLTIDGAKKLYKQARQTGSSYNYKSASNTASRSGFGASAGRATSSFGG